ncbi:MAG TPA: hypothetical protein VK978_01590 [Candidatus Saccharimonadales bacterium]|nr:hypothetical protein [Candidatus Saccharimonadales bacterium]
MNQSPENDHTSPDMLDFEIIRLKPADRLELMLAMLGSIAERGLLKDPETALQTANRSMEHFEVVSSAAKKFVSGIDSLFETNGYQLRIFHPEPMTEEH